MKFSRRKNQVIGNRNFEQLIKLVHDIRMSHWASDLLHEGLCPEEVRVAVSRAMKTCTINGLDVKRHFQMKCTSGDPNPTFDDCKMTELGYFLTVMNANPSHPYVAKFQMQVIQSQMSRSGDPCQ